MSPASPAVPGYDRTSGPSALALAVAAFVVGLLHPLAYVGAVVTYHVGYVRSPPVQTIYTGVLLGAPPVGLAMGVIALFRSRRERRLRRLAAVSVLAGVVFTIRVGVLLSEI
jgi:hypothetical protein